MMTMRNFAILLLSALATMLRAQAPTVFATGYNDACGNGTGGVITNVFGGTPPYAYAWAPGLPTEDGPSITGLFAGTYTVTVTDAIGGTATASATLVATSELLQASASGPAANSCNGQCNGTWYRGGFLGGSSPYIVTVDPPDGNGSATPNGISVNGLCPGVVYAVTVTDANGCSSTFSNVNVNDASGPGILSQTIEPPCDGGTFGVAEVVFDQVLTNAVVVSGSGTVSIQGNILNVSDLPAGTTIINCFGSSQFCPRTVVLEVIPSGDCALLTGIVFADMDEECTLSQGDLPIPYRMLMVQPGDRHVLTSDQGTFALGLPFGSFTLDQSFVDFAPSCADPFPVPFLLEPGNSVFNADLAQGEVLGADVQAFVQANAHRIGQIVVYTVQARNNSAYTITGLNLDLVYDQLLGFVSTSLPPALNLPGQLRWQVPFLDPFSTFSAQAWLQVPADGQLLGTIVPASATITLPGPDAVPSNDVYPIAPEITLSVEPSYKYALTSSRISDHIYYLNEDAHIDFIVRFQNVSDVDVINVSIVDTISTQFDLATLEILGASHAFKAELSSARSLRFDLDGITLPPSSGNEPQSHGFVAFRIRPVDGLVPGTILKNIAHVVMDQQPPIMTNLAELVIDLSTGLAGDVSPPVHLFPNPVVDRSQVLLGGGTHRIEVFAADGRLVLQQQRSGYLVTLDAGMLAAGTYLLRCINEQGTIRQTRFVKE